MTDYDDEYLGWDPGYPPDPPCTLLFRPVERQPGSGYDNKTLMKVYCEEHHIWIGPVRKVFKETTTAKDRDEWIRERAGKLMQQCASAQQRLGMAARPTPWKPTPRG